jgi:hypothetical protein
MRPVHKIQPNRRSVVAFTWCGVDPARKGVEVQWPGQTVEVTCKECLRAEAEAAKTAGVRRPVKVKKLKVAALPPSLLASQIDSLIEQHGVDTILMEIRGYVYGRIDGTGPWEDYYEILVDATRRVRDLKERS